MKFKRISKQIMVLEIVVSVILLFVGIAVLVIIHMCVVGRAFRREFAGDVVLQMGSIPIVKGVGMNPQDLKKLPCFEYREGGTGEKGAIASPLDCAVCLDIFKVGDKCRTLPNCDHWFHVHCVDIWLMKTPLCPLCRTDAKPTTNVEGSAIGELSSTPSIVADDLL